MGRTRCVLAFNVLPMLFYLTFYEKQIIMLFVRQEILSGSYNDEKDESGLPFLK